MHMETFPRFGISISHILHNKNSWLLILLVLGTGFIEKVKRGYVSCQCKNIFLTPAHDWMNNFIQY